MNRIKGLRRKLASRRGASITFALLLFLVCTVIGVIVLVAATAASGRMSRLAESDARYYAVDSAAQYLRQEIEGNTITVVRRATTGTYTSKSVTYVCKIDDEHFDNVNGKIVTEPDPVYSGYVNPDPEASLPFLADIVKLWVYGGTDSPADKWNYVPAAPAASADLSSGTLALKDGAATLGQEVKVTAGVHATGQLMVTLECQIRPGETYAVTLFFKTEHGDDGGAGINTKPQPVTPTLTGQVVGTIYGEEQTDTFTDTKTDTFKWTFAGMTIGKAAAE